MGLKKVKLVCTQSGADAFVQASKRLGSRRVVRIVRMDVFVKLGAIPADLDEWQLQLTNVTKAAISNMSDHTVQWFKDVLVTGAVSSAFTDLSWTVHNIPPFETSEIFVSFDTVSRSAADTAYFNIYYEEKKVGY